MLKISDVHWDRIKHHFREENIPDARADYQYNGMGERVRRTTDIDDTYTLYDEAGQWLGDYAANGLPLEQVIWLDDLPVGLLAGSGASATLYHIQPDHLGTPRAVIDPSRDVAVWHWELKGEAFGATPPDPDPDRDGVSFVFDMRYPGQRYDSVSGLHYNYFRDYDPGTGRYVQSDPVGLDGGINSFGYVGGNPLNRLDAFGLCECKAVSTDAGSQGTGVHYVSPRWFGKFGSVHNVTCTYECRRNPGDEADIIRAEHEERYITSPDWDNGMEGTCLGTNFSAVYDHNRNKTIYSPLNALPFDPADGDNRGFQSPDLKKWAENNCPECNRGILFRDFNRKKP